MTESLTFLSQKLSRVRWHPTASTLQKPEKFATGSYEDPESNSVTVYGTSHMTRSKTSDWFEEADLENSLPKKLFSYITNGDVRGLEFADSGILAAGLSSGDVVLFNFEANQQILSTSCEWDSLHAFGGSTDVAVELPDVVSVGEDGSLHVLRVGATLPLRSLVHGDSCPITCVKYLNSQQVCTTNTMGQLRIWDLRSPGDYPTRIIVSSDTLTAALSVDRHPTQNHVIATGGADGCVTLFDARKECAPVTRLQVHDEDVWEVRFHPNSPSNVFTCSGDGSARRMKSSFEMKSLAFGASPVEMSQLLDPCGASVNSLDVCADTLLCCTDAESLYIFNVAL